MTSGIVTSAVLGEAGVQYDIDKFHWLGATDNTFHYAFFTRKELGLNTIEKLRAHAGLRIVATSIGHTTYTYGRTFAWLLGLKEPKFVLGYSSIEVDVAMSRGELDARSNNTAEVIRRNRDAVRKGVFDFCGDPENTQGRQGAAIRSHPRTRYVCKIGPGPPLSGIDPRHQVRRHYLLPPNTPKEQVQILREAMKETF